MSPSPTLPHSLHPARHPHPTGSMTAPREPLSFKLHAPPDARDGSPVLVLLHGRGSDASDLQGFAPILPDGWIVVTPQAPFPAAPWGYGPGWAWYRYVAEDRVVEETLEESLTALDAFMGTLDDLLPVRPGTRILGGFSQGGTTSLAWALSRRGGLGGVVNLSGFLVDTPSVAVTPESVASLRVFWGHGERDPAIPFALALRGRERLVSAGCPVETFDHPGGHSITREELAALVGWVQGGTDRGE